MNIDQIIGKLMGDDSIGEEKSALETWKKEAEENIKALEEIKKIASFSSSMKGYKEFDADAAWNDFEQKMEDSPAVEANDDNSSKTEESGASIFQMNKWRAIAAVFVALIGATYLFQTSNTDSLGFEPVEYVTLTEGKAYDLNDGSIITMDSNTKLRVNAPRTISMKGRAFFDVAKDPQEKFTVKMPIGEITVLGTKFSVDADKESTSIFVEEGSVRYNLDKNRTWILKEGDLVEVKNGDAVLTKNNDSNITSWKSKKIVFRDNNMTEVVDALSRHFAHSISLKNPKNFTNCNVHTDFTNASLEDILNELSQTHGLKYVIDGTTYIITESKC